MRRPSLTAILLAACAPAFGAMIQPGEWEIHSSTTSPLFGAAQKQVFKYCVTQDDAEHPEAWMARQSAKGECKITPGGRTAESMSWQMSCPRTNMTGSGTAHLTGPDTVEGEMQLHGGIQGYSVQMNTRMSGRRLGPCKS
jgi:hypothetical protein